MKKIIRPALCAFVFLTLLLSGCASAPAPIPPTPTPLPTHAPVPTTSTSTPRHGPKAGFWTGSSSVSFTVTADGGISDFSIVVSLFGRNCTLTIDKIVPDIDGAFVVTSEFKGKEHRVTTLSGKFESDSTMSGTAGVQFCQMSDGFVLVLDVFPPPVEWTAEWKSAAP